MKKINERKKIIFYNIISLCYLYAIIAFAYSLIYMVAELSGLGKLYDRNGEDNLSLLGFLFKHIYFSFITLTSVAYGDIEPLGLSRFFSVSQALIGYILPYVIILKNVIYSPKFLKNKSLD